MEPSLKKVCTDINVVEHFVSSDSQLTMSVSDTIITKLRNQLKTFQDLAGFLYLDDHKSCKIGFVLADCQIFLTPFVQTYLELIIISNQQEVKILPDLYNINFPSSHSKDNHVLLFLQVLTSYLPIIKEEYFAVQKLIDDDEKNIYYCQEPLDPTLFFQEMQNMSFMNSVSLNQWKSIRSIDLSNWKVENCKEKKKSQDIQCYLSDASNQRVFKINLKCKDSMWCLNTKTQQTKMRRKTFFPNPVQHFDYIFKELLEKQIVNL